MEIQIRPALPNVSEQLTAIAFAAKRIWDYPESYFQVWESELTVTKDYIEKNIVFVACFDEKTIGFYSIVVIQNDTIFGNVLVKKGFWMEHLFIDPQFQYKGVGGQLMKHALAYCSENWIDDLKIFVDPHAIGFYEKMGAIFLENSPSSIVGREIPVYGYRLEE